MLSGDDDKSAVFLSLTCIFFIYTSTSTSFVYCISKIYKSVTKKTRHFYRLCHLLTTLTQFFNPSREFAFISAIIFTNFFNSFPVFTSPKGGWLATQSIPPTSALGSSNRRWQGWQWTTT